jgi:hypothetical protein
MTSNARKRKHESLEQLETLVQAVNPTSRSKLFDFYNNVHALVAASKIRKQASIQASNIKDLNQVICNGPVIRKKESY